MAVFLTNYRIKYGIDKKDESLCSLVQQRKKWLFHVQKNLWASCKQFCCFILAANFSIMPKDFLYTAEYQ